MQSVFKELSDYHSEPSMTAGKYKVVHVSSTIFAFHRQFPDWPGYLVVTNFGGADEKLDFDVMKNEDGEVITNGVFQLSSDGEMPDNKKITFRDYTIKAATSVLIKT